MNDPAAAVKLALMAPVATKTEGGTVRLGLLEESAIDAPGGEAALLSVIEQVDIAFGFSDTGVQLSVMTCGSVARLIEAATVLALKEAVICAELSVVNVPAVAVKLALVAPAATKTEGWTVRPGLLDESATGAPVAGAALLSATEQVDIAFGFSDTGLQFSVVITGG